MPIKTYFATGIYVDNLRAQGMKRFNDEILEQCYLVRDTDDEGQEWSADHYLHGYTSYGSITDLHQRFPHFEELAREIDRHVKRFARKQEWDLQGGRLEMTTCWINIMPTHAAHSLHLHPLSVVSGTYYVAVPKGASSIKFEDPRLSRLMAAPPKIEGAKNQPFVTLDPRPGQVALWESWLRHEVPPNRSPGDRISISFNYDWR